MLPLGMNMGLTPRGLAPVSLLSASISADGLELLLTFSRPVVYIGDPGSIALLGNYRELYSVSASVLGSVATVTLGSTPIYSDEAFTCEIAAGVFVDSSGNDLGEVFEFPVTNNSTVAYPAGALVIAVLNPEHTASDASHLVPCGDGDSIRWIRDAVSGTWYEQATSGDRFVLRANGANKWYAEGGGTRKHSFAVPTMPGSAGMVCSRFAGQTTGATWVPVSLNASEFARFFGDGNAYARNFRVTRADAFFAAPNDTDPHTYTQVSGADYRAFLDGTLKATTAADWAAPNQMLIGASDSSGSQNIAAVAVFPDGTNRAEVETWIARFM